jgi:hypothetical protein
VGIFGSSRNFVGSSFFLFVFGTDVVLLTRSANSHRNQQRQADSGRSVAAARRRHGLEIKDKGLLKDLVIIFVFLEVLCIVCYFF